MRFRIPPQHKETVSIIRRSAFFRDQAEAAAMESDVEKTIAPNDDCPNVVCMIQPLTSGIPQREATQLREGVPIAQAEMIALLEKPNPNIAKGDFLVRSCESEFRIVDILHVKGSPVMRLYLRGQGVL